MKKIPSLFKRDYEGDRRVLPELVEGSEWVLTDEGVRATRKWDGTSVMFRDKCMFKRYDRKRPHPTKPWKDAPEGWEACADEPDENTGHWPGWLPVGDGKGDQWHRIAFAGALAHSYPADGTYELCGPAINGNPERFASHVLIPHGVHELPWTSRPEVPIATSFGYIHDFLAASCMEGIVWYHLDGRMCKIKSRDFGLPWGRR